MPYIEKEKRDFAKSHPLNSGELNFAITKVINLYVQGKGLSYQNINDVMGALEGAKLEFYRRIAVPYENEKLAINGDVYGKEKE